MSIDTRTPAVTRLYLVVYAALVVAYYSLAVGWSAPPDIKSTATAFMTPVAPALLFVVVFERYLWRPRYVRRLLSITTPLLDGRWEGWVLSSWSDHAVKHPIAIEIDQTLSTTQLWYFDANAVTHSLAIGIESLGAGSPARIYVAYHNRPHAAQYDDLHTHSGMMELNADRDGRRLWGIYYNNPHQRNTYGELWVKRVDSPKTGAFQDGDSRTPAVAPTSSPEDLPQQNPMGQVSPLKDD